MSSPSEDWQTKLDLIPSDFSQCKFGPIEGDKDSIARVLAGLTNCNVQVDGEGLVLTVSPDADISLVAGFLAQKKGIHPNADFLFF
jgi:hypothetical protein